MKRVDAINYLQRCQFLVGSVPAEVEAHVACVGVHPLNLAYEMDRLLLSNRGQPPTEPSVACYRVKKFEVERALIERDVFFPEQALKNVDDAFVYGEGNLAEHLLQRHGLTLEDLQHPSVTDYPL